MQNISIKSLRCGDPKQEGKKNIRDILTTPEPIFLQWDVEKISEYPFNRPITIAMAQKHLSIPEYAFFSEDEIKRKDRLLRQEDAELYVVSHHLKRQLCAAKIKAPAHTLRFAAHTQGKPYLKPPHDALHFNLSHSEAWCGVAACKGTAIGLDIQSPFGVGDAPFESFVHKDDIIIPRTAQDKALLWSMKEAVLKAQGIGLGLSLHEISVQAHEQEGLFAAQVYNVDYTIGLWQLPGGYAVALASTNMQDVDFIHII